MNASEIPDLPDSKDGKMHRLDFTIKNGTITGKVDDVEYTLVQNKWVKTKDMVVWEIGANGVAHPEGIITSVEITEDGETIKISDD